MLLERDGVRLAGLDFGGVGPPALLLHGLAGYAGEWTATARWLTSRCRVVALDARGHGGSERTPADVSRAAHVADAAFVIERLGLGPAIVVGQSLGGQAALLLAAEHPSLVRGLVLADAGPGGFDDARAVEANVEDLARALGRWPVPFASREAAIAFFGGPSPSAEAWADGLEQRDGGWWPRFDADVMARTLREATRRSYWPQWERISCAALVVRAGRGQLSAVDARKMAERGRRADVVEIPDAGHDVHLDSPGAWRDAASRFLDALDAG
jgi:pimeloyl-ACP methyl ester carboxylesterase